jgi:hypothetical protein
MDVETCIDQYIKLASKIFPVETILAKSQFVKLTKALGGHDRFDPAPFEIEIKKIISDYLADRSEQKEHTLLRFESSRDMKSPKCKVLVYYCLMPPFAKVLTE